MAFAKHTGKLAAGFTLAELLTLVAIIALLSAIAVPNLYESRAAADIAQVKTDLRAIEAGMEAYKLDRGFYVKMNHANLSFLPPSRAGHPGYDLTMERLTTPVSYLDGKAPFWNPFDAIGAQRLGSAGYNSTPIDEDTFKQYYFATRDSWSDSVWGDERDGVGSTATWYILQSSGPDRLFYYLGTEVNTLLAQNTAFTRQVCIDMMYDTTNGTVSRGSIWKVGGTPEGRGAVLGEVFSEHQNSRILEWAQQER